MCIRGISASISSQNRVIAEPPNTSRPPPRGPSSVPSSYSNDARFPRLPPDSPMRKTCTGQTRHRHGCSRPCFRCRHAPGRWRRCRCSRSRRAAGSVLSSPGRGRRCCSEPGSQSCSWAVGLTRHRPPPPWLPGHQPPRSGSGLLLLARGWSPILRRRPRCYIATASAPSHHACEIWSVNDALTDLAFPSTCSSDFFDRPTPRPAPTPTATPMTSNTPRMMTARIIFFLVAGAIPFLSPTLVSPGLWAPKAWSPPNPAPPAAGLPATGAANRPWPKPRSRLSCSGGVGVPSR